MHPRVVLLIILIGSLSASAFVPHYVSSWLWPHACPDAHFAAKNSNNEDETANGASPGEGSKNGDTLPWDWIKDEGYKSWILEVMPQEAYNGLGVVVQRKLLSMYKKEKQEEAAAAEAARRAAAEATRKKSNGEVDEAWLRENCVYRFGLVDGVDPSTDYVPRRVTEDILDDFPQTFAGRQDFSSRVLLYGEPGSGKTSILGKIYEELKKRYQDEDVPVLYLNGSSRYRIRDKVMDTLQFSFGSGAVVILDDAHMWYDSDHFHLFKDPSYLLVAASTYRVGSYNPETPIPFAKRFSSALTEDEATALFDRMNVNAELRSDLLDWFGYSFGRMKLLVPSLLTLWKEATKSQPELTLSDYFSRSSTLTEELDTGIVQRFFPEPSEEMRVILWRQFRGQLGKTERKKLARYGIFDENGEWSCDFVRRHYFSSIFQSSDKEWGLISKNNIPSSLDLLKKGLEELSWSRLRDSRESSTSGFPIEDIWQAEFYSAIGHFIPKDIGFCKERVVGTDNRVDFVLKNGSTRGIEFMLRSAKLGVHHQRFEAGGAYAPLKLDEYIVVDILPWDDRNKRALEDVSEKDRTKAANKLFQKKALTTARRRVHAIFLVSDDLDYGGLYTWNETKNTAVLSTWSPRT